MCRESLEDNVTQIGRIRLVGGAFISDHAHISLLGVPFRCNYWLAQCGVILMVMLVMKLIIGPLAVFHFWTKVWRTI